MENSWKMTAKYPSKIRLYNCIICPTRSTNGLFSFPKCPDFRQQWLSACQRTSVKSCEKICYLHFEDTCFLPRYDGNYRLWKDCVPTLYLPRARRSQNNDHTAHKKVHSEGIQDTLNFLSVYEFSVSKG